MSIITIHKDWEDVVKNDKEKALFQALADNRWEWRTIDTLVKESGMAEKEVYQAHENYHDLIKRSSVPAKDGTELFTLRSHYIERQSFLTKAQRYIKKEKF